MSLSTVTLLMSCFITWLIVGYSQDLRCDPKFDLNLYSFGRRFSSSIGGRTYDCDCRGQNCEQITCIKFQPITNSQIRDSDQVCTDPQTGRSYARGTSYMRPTTTGVNLACICSEEGPPKIKCKRPQCVIPPPPPPVKANLNPRNGSCYDQHNDAWHPWNTPYIRRVVMSYAPDIIGEYRCVCSALSTRCTATNIPCCDTRKGRFVAKDERFVTEMDGLLPMNCLCLGGKGRIGSCEALNDRREIGQGTRERNNMCLDKVSKRYYPVGSTFLQIRRNGERRCTCNRTRRRLKIICKSIRE